METVSQPSRGWYGSGRWGPAGLDQRRGTFGTAPEMGCLESAGDGTQEQREPGDWTLWETREREDLRQDDAVVVPTVVKTGDVKRFGGGGVGDEVERSQRDDHEHVDDHSRRACTGLASRI